MNMDFTSPISPGDVVWFVAETEDGKLKVESSKVDHISIYNDVVEFWAGNIFTEPVPPFFLEDIGRKVFLKEAEAKRALESIAEENKYELVL